MSKGEKGAVRLPKILVLIDPAIVSQVRVLLDGGQDCPQWLKSFAARSGGGTAPGLKSQPARARVASAR